jgi:hypothetical protein
MKLILTTLSLLISSYCFSQCVYITNNKSLADYKIYITDNEWQADWIVCNVDSWYTSQQTRGWWYITKYQYQADFTIYITDNNKILLNTIMASNNGIKRSDNVSANIVCLSFSVVAFLMATTAVCDVPKFTKIEASTEKDKAKK